MAQFERSYGFKQHDHLICIECGRVEEFCDPRIQEIRVDMGTFFHHKVRHHSLHLYASCEKLTETGECPHFNKNS